MSPTVTAVIVALISGTTLTVLFNFIKWLWERGKESQPEAVRAQKVREAVAQADQSLLVVARSRDAAVDDAAKWRAYVNEERIRCDQEKDQRDEEIDRLRAEVESLRRTLEKRRSA